MGIINLSKPGFVYSRFLIGTKKRLGKKDVRWASSVKTEREKVVRCRRDAELSICLMEEGSIDPTLEQPRVVIVGAGLAGLSAANRLLQCGLENFVVLEASDRPGGRIHSCKQGDITYDLGADKIYGSSPMNPVHTLAAREGLMVDMQQNKRGGGICLMSSGRPVPRLVDLTAQHSMALIEKQAIGLSGKREAAGKTLWDFVSNRIIQEIDIYPPLMRSPAARKMYGLTNDLRNFMGTDLSNTGLQQFGSKFGAYGPCTSVRTGMVGILAPLLRPMPTCDHILYCKKVEKIVWSDKLSSKPDRVKVLCCDSTVYPADYVIVALPLGVLKEKAESMFAPRLNDEKMNAIKTVGFGNICRILLEYERPFWVWRSGTMTLGWSLAELKSRESCPDWVKAIGTVEEVAGTQQALSFNVAGPEADIAEGLPDVKIAEDFTRVVRRFTGDDTLPYPSNVVKSAWRANEFSKGARPYFTPKSIMGHLCELAMPVPEEEKGVPSLLFAGDHACPLAVGLMDGARSSGVREADRVLRVTRKLAGRPRPEAVDAAECKERNRNFAMKN